MTHVCRTRSRLIVYTFAIISQNYFALTNCLLPSSPRELNDRHTTPHHIDLFVTLDQDLLSTSLQLFCILFLQLVIVWAIIHPFLATYYPSTKLFASSFTSTERSPPTTIQSRSQFIITLGGTMGKSDNDEPEFSFAKLAGTDNYKKWAREMRYSLESARLWDLTLPNQENPKPVGIILKDKELEDDVQLERQEKRADRVISSTKNNVQCKGDIGRMSLGHIQQEFQAVKTDWLAYDPWKWLKKRYTLQNSASKCATITSIDELTHATCKNIAEYRSKYYTHNASIKEQSISIEDALKIRLLNNLWPAFKTYLTVVNDRMRKDEKLKEDDVLFKAIEEEKTRIKADHRASVNLVSTKSNAKPQGGAAKIKKEFVE